MRGALRLQTRTHQYVERGVSLVHFAGDLRKQRHDDDDDDDDGVSRDPLARPDLDGLVTPNRRRPLETFSLPENRVSVFFSGSRTVPIRRVKTTKGIPTAHFEAREGSVRAVVARSRHAFQTKVYPRLLVYRGAKTFPTTKISAL